MAAHQTDAGNFLEDFTVGQVIQHATPRTVTVGDVALYQALYGSRFVLQSSDEFARACGLPRAPIDDLLTFHIVFGKTVPDISLNAVANLGYAECRFSIPVYPGDTLSTTSTVLGVKENSNRQTGVVYVRSAGRNQRGETVLEYVRWVMVRKRAEESKITDSPIPKLQAKVEAKDLVLTAEMKAQNWDNTLAGSSRRWEAYQAGDKIDHRDGMTIEEAEHQLATRLYQNTARVHFNQHAEGRRRFGRRLIYGGHIISLARALSFNGLANGCKLLAINAGRHVAPTFAGNTIYAWSEVLEAAPLPGSDFGALRLRTIATKDLESNAFPGAGAAGGQYPAEVVLDMDYWVALPV